MRIGALTSRARARLDDRTTRARIRDAAILCVAAFGLGEMTARRVAEMADVSPGSVIHHYGSMEGLRAACDEHIVATVKDTKTSAAQAGTAIDPMQALRQQADGPPVSRYLAQVLVDGSPLVDALVDELVADAVEYSEQMVASGLMKPTEDPRGRAVIMVLWSLGNLVLAPHIERLLGVDITDTPDDPAAARAYMAPTLELMHDGLMTDRSYELMRDAFVTGGTDTEHGKGVAS